MKMILVTLTYSEDIYSYLLTEEEYEAWPNDEDCCSYINNLNIPEQRSFVDLADLIRFIKENNLEIIHHIPGCGY